MALPAWLLSILGGAAKGLMTPDTQERQSFGKDAIAGTAGAFQNNFNVMNAANRSAMGASAAGPVTPNLFSGGGGGGYDFGKLPGSGQPFSMGNSGFGAGIDAVNKQAQNRPHFLGTPAGIDIPNAFGPGGGGSGGGGGGGVGGGLGTSGLGVNAPGPGEGGGLGPAGMGSYDPTSKDDINRGNPGMINKYEPGENQVTDQQYWDNQAAGIYDDPNNPNGGLGALRDLPWGQILGIIGAVGGIPGLGNVLGGGGGNPQGQTGGWGPGSGSDSGFGSGPFAVNWNNGAFQTAPGMARQVPGQPGQPVPIMAHGGEMVGRPGGVPPQAGPPSPAPGMAPPQQPMGQPPQMGFQAPPPAMTTGATMPQTQQPVSQGTQAPPQDDEQYVSAASLLGSLGAI